MRVADYIMQRLVEENVKHIFLITGRGMLYLSDAAAKQGDLECVCMHNEQALSYAAMAYAQQTQNLGACLVSTGCASTNAITGVLCAWQDDVPCIFISGQNALRETTRHTKLDVRTFGQQEADIIKLVEPITKYAVMIEDPNSIVYELEKAIFLAKSGRKGPVWLDVPLDIQNMRIDLENLATFVVEHQYPDVKDDDLEYFKVSLEKAQRPVVLIGGGIRSAQAVLELANFVEKFKLPLVNANSAVDVYGDENELAIGTVAALGGNRAANFTVQNADLVIVIGTRLTSMTVGNDPDKFAREANIIWIDIDSNEILKNTVNCSKFICADAKDFLEKVLSMDIAQLPNRKFWIDKCLHWKQIFPKCEPERKQSEKVDLYNLSDTLGQLLDNESIVVCDAGLEELIVPTTLSFKFNQRLLQSHSQGAMGYALPAAIGAYYASKKTVVVIVGDGSIMMNLQELQTITHNRLPIKIIVVNNNAYAVIRKRQQDLFRTRTIGTDSSNGLSCPDFSKVAHCFNLSYKKIEKSSQLKNSLKEMLQAQSSVLCEVMALEDQTYIHSSFARTKNGKFVQRPIEDQSPYLERDLFCSEMIITPIDQ